MQIKGDIIKLITHIKVLIRHGRGHIRRKIHTHTQ